MDQGVVKFRLGASLGRPSNAFLPAVYVGG
jgi:hypothetical protein